MLPAPNPPDFNGKFVSAFGLTMPLLYPHMKSGVSKFQKPNFAPDSSTSIMNEKESGTNPVRKPFRGFKPASNALYEKLIQMPSGNKLLFKRVE